MKQEKYEKALKIHGEKLGDYAVRLHELVDEMDADELSGAEITAILETEKLYRFNSDYNYARTKAMFDGLDGLLESLGGEED